MISKFLCLLLLSSPAFANIRVVTTIPDIAWAATQIGGNKVTVQSLLRGTEDPHFADAKPDFILKVARADVVCAVGLELEIGWLPKVLDKSGNSKVQAGGAGFCELGRNVKVLEKPEGKLNRSMGDVHALGNPHFWLSPLALADGSKSILEALIAADSGNSSFYEQNYKKLRENLNTIYKTNKARLASAQNFSAIQYHKEFTYFFDAYGIKSFGSIEEIPGVPPSAARLAHAAVEAKQNKVKIALAAEHNPQDLLKKFEELSGIPTLLLPTSVQPEGDVKDYPALQTRIVDAILKAKR